MIMRIKGVETMKSEEEVWDTLNYMCKLVDGDFCIDPVECLRRRCYIAALRWVIDNEV